MQKNILEKWQDLNQVYIPPLETVGFTENVLDRDIWKRQESKAKNEQPVQEEKTSPQLEAAPAQEISLAKDFRAESLEEKTTLLLDEEPSEEDRTVLLAAEEPVERAYIIRTATNERIDLDKDNFSIGKSAKADYQIHGNDAISRIHIRIKKTDEGYLMEDQDSLNHTYIADQEISSPVMLEHGLSFKLADEEFCFYLEKGEV